MKAYLKNYRQSPRKVRIIGNLVKGKSVPHALTELSFLIKRGAGPVRKLVASAAANAKANDGIDAANLIVKNVTVNKGMVLRRLEYKARGSANVLHKRASNITVELATKSEAKVKKGASKKTSETAEAPKVPKAKATKKVTTKK